MDVPTYFEKYIDSKINLREIKSICCPFHGERTPSFTYRADRDIWRCWGKCHFGGDVIAMHQKWHNYKTREEALQSLAALLHVDVEDEKLEYSAPNTNPELIKYLTLRGRASVLSKTPEDYVELDYIVGQHMSYSEMSALLEVFCCRFE